LLLTTGKALLQYLSLTKVIIIYIKTNTMILVTGATGNLGKATINSLLNKGISANNIAALVRDESKSAEFKSKGIQVRLATIRILSL
jgi:FlaA1/EpsC-like NDP-sugar epimerase